MQGDIAPDPKPEPYKPHDAMLYLAADRGRSFRCGCGCNVFTQHGTMQFRCNGCKSEYEATPLQEGTP